VACLLAASIGAAASASDLPALREQVSVLQGQAKHGDAATLLQDALARLADPASAQAAELWQLLAQVQQRTGEPRLAFDSAERALQLHRQLFGANDGRTRSALRTYLGTCADADQSRRCEAEATEAVNDAARRAEASGANTTTSVELATLLRIQSQIVIALGRPEAALALADRALHLWRANPTYQGREYLAARLARGLNLGNLGRFVEARAELDELLAVQRNLFGDRDPDLLMTMYVRGRMLIGAERYAEAIAALQKAALLSVSVLGPDHFQTYRARTDLGLAQSLSGDLVDAVATLQEVSEGASKRYGSSSSYALQSRSYYARALGDAGYFQRATEILRPLVSDYLALLGHQHPNVPILQQSLALALERAGDVNEALKVFQQAFDALVRMRGPQDAITMAVRTNQLIVQHRVGVPVPLDDSMQVLTWMAKSYGEDHLKTWNARLFQARLLAETGELDAALASMRAVVEARQRLVGDSHRESLRAKAVLGMTLAKAGRRDEALALLAPLSAQVDAQRRSLAALGPASQRQRTEYFQPALAEYAVLLAQEGRLEQAFDAIEAGKARTLLDQLSRQRALTSGVLPAAQQQRLLRLATQSNMLEARIGDATGPQHREALQRQLNDVRRELEAALGEARLNSPRFARLLDVDPATTQDLSLLDAHSALVHFLKADGERWFAMVRGRSGPPHWVELGRWPGLEASVEALRAKPAGASSELRQQLGERLLQPLLPVLGGATRLLISPDGALGLLPWDLLLVEGRSALQRWAISQIPSLSVLKQTTRQESANGRLALLALAASDGMEVDGQVWPALPLADHEARAAATLFKAQGSRALTGQQASEATLRQLSGSGELARYRRLLVAAHGRFDAGRPEAHAVLLARSGSAAEDDGVLSVADWLGLRLNSELVLMSACDTARGTLSAGEGLVGFAYALNLAGNRDLLATLWPVSDQLASEFVLDFLGRVRRGLGHAQALVQTKRAFAGHANTRLRDPRIWAAFALVGQ
jgi:CHAT domain-containing protein